MTKNNSKALIFTILGISQRKKLMIVKIFTVWILCICVLIMQVDTLRKKNENKYLVFDSEDENKELLKTYNTVWNEIKNKIKEVSNSECDYGKDYMKIRFNTDDN